jgi:hypothetical protein
MLQEFCDWLAKTRLSHAFANEDWFVPTVQTVHILAIAAVVTTLFMLYFRLLNITRRGPSAHNLAVHYLPWVWRALGILLVTGLLLTITEPERELMNGSFRIKMLLVLNLVVITCIVHSTFRTDPEYWNRTRRRRILVRAIAVVSLTLCMSIVAAGRLIAYV